VAVHGIDLAKVNEFETDVKLNSGDDSLQVDYYKDADVHWSYIRRDFS